MYIGEEANLPVPIEVQGFPSVPVGHLDSCLSFSKISKNYCHFNLPRNAIKVLLKCYMVSHLNFISQV